MSAEAAQVHQDESDAIKTVLDALPRGALLVGRDFTITWVNEEGRSLADRLGLSEELGEGSVEGGNLLSLFSDTRSIKKTLTSRRSLPHTVVVPVSGTDLTLEIGGLYVGTRIDGYVVLFAEQGEVEPVAKAASGPDLSKELEELTTALFAVSGGDLSRPIRVRDPRLEGLGKSIDAVLGTFRDQTSLFAENAGRLSSAADQLTDASGRLSTNVDQSVTLAKGVTRATEEVDANVQAVASAAEEMTASISEIAQSASQAAQVAQSAVRMADETNSTINRLGGASNEIGEVIKVITSIAQQTNLLALNATIEAARAGEAGKGFAVVANEVKELAKETARATEDIGKKIEAIQQETQRAVNAIREIGAIINRISEIQDNIASAVEEQSATTNEISRNAVVAATSTGQITNSARQMVSQSEAASRAVSATQAAGMELRGMAVELERLAGTVKL